MSGSQTDYSVVLLVSYSSVLYMHGMQVKTEVSRGYQDWKTLYNLQVVLMASEL